MSLKIPDLRLDLVSLEAHILDHCVPNVVQDTGEWHCLHFSKDGRSRTIRFMLGPDGRAKGYITRRPDDTIEEWCADDRCQWNIFHDRNWMITELKTTVTANLLRRAILEWNPEKAAAVITCHDVGPRVKSLINTQAGRITAQATQNAVTPSGGGILRTPMFLQESNRLIRDQILNKDVYSLTRRLYPAKEYPAILHNNVVNNLTNLALMNAREPALLKMACRLLPAEDLLMKDPEGVEDALREKLEVPTDFWPLAKTLIHNSEWDTTHTAPHIAATLKTVQALTKVPETTNLLRAITQCPDIHACFQETGGDMPKKWTTLLNDLCRRQTEEDESNTPWQNIYTLLTRARSEAMLHHRAGLTWNPPASWKACREAYQIK